MFRALLIAVAMLTTTFAQAQMPAPPIEMVDPGPAGRRVVGNGWVGNYYPAPRKGPAVLLLGGSEGGLAAGTSRIAQALLADGYSVLHLSYFRAPGQAESLARVPLELFGDGLAWLAKQPEVDGARLAMVGGSKGAEAALIVAASNPAVKATVAGMPSSVVWPGFSWTGGPVEGSTWTRDGKDVPALPYGRFDGGIASVYANGLKRLEAHPGTAIPVERASGPVLLICGEQDSLWPACAMARQLNARAPARVEVLAFANAGHAVFGPPLETQPAPAALAALGGTPEGNAQARAIGWPRVLAFLRAALSPTDTTAPRKAISKENSSMFTPNDFKQLRFLEGRWSGKAPDGSVFYEEYDFPNQAIMRSRRYADANFAEATDGSTVALKEGMVISTWGEFTWEASDLSENVASFRPINAPSSFTWRRLNQDAVEVTQNWTDEKGAAQSYSLTLTRVIRRDRKQ